MHQYLEQQADAIEAVLADHGLDGRVAGGTLSPRLIHYNVSVPAGIRLADVGEVLFDLAARLDAMAVRLAPDPATGAPVLEVPRPDPHPVALLPIARQVTQVVPACTATLGMDTTGVPLLLRLDAPEVGAVLVSGERGSGKSALLRSMALGLALHNGPDTVRLLLLDLSSPARRGRPNPTWADVAELPHLLCPPLHDAHEAALRLQWVVRLLERRADLVAYGEPIEDANLVVLLDGLDEALLSPDGRSIAQALVQIIAQGRDLGVQLVATARQAGDVARLGWGTRVAGRCLGDEAAMAAQGLTGIGVEGLLGGGDFLIVLGGEVTRFQAAWITPDEVARTVALLQACAARQPAEDDEFSPAWPVARPYAAARRRSLRALWRGA